MTDKAVLICPKEAAERLGISVKTLRGLVADGALPRIVVGRGNVRRHYAFDPVDIEAFIRRRREWKTDRSSIAPSQPNRKKHASTARSFVGFTELMRLRAEGKLQF